MRFANHLAEWATVFVVFGSGMALAQSTGNFKGELWILPQSQVGGSGSQCNYRPAATPDATFTTRHLSLWMSAPAGVGYPVSPEINNSVQGFLNSAHPVASLSFSGLFNATIGAVVGPSTPIVYGSGTSSGTSGVLIRFRGYLPLVNGQLIEIEHDDGAALMIDGVLQSGITAGGGGDLTEAVTFTGATGTHEIFLDYCNVEGPGILSFEPKM